MEAQYYTTPKTSRYYQLGKPTDKTKCIWFVLHGYMQLAEDFISKFKLLDNEENIIIAPEALSRAYIKHSSGKVGASWMTKEDREVEIVDYIYYLDGLSDNIMEHIGIPEIQINILGFSQGVATAARWVLEGKIDPKNLILWSGVFPPDMETKLSSKRMKDIKITTLVGDEDPYYLKPEYSNPFQILDEADLDYKHIGFEGKHDIYDKPLQKLIKELD